MEASKPERLGPYEIVEEIGRGGMGVVYKGRDRVLERTVAVKTLLTGTPFDASLPRERLLQEARSAAGLTHPNIVTVYQAGVQEGWVYIAMEYIDGPTLEKWLSEEKAKDIQAVIGLLRQVAAGLDYAHGKGIVHRDVKPLNILVDDSGNARISDFGLAKVVTSSMLKTLTPAGMLVGTPQYMSPEHAQGRPLNGRSDQFSLAVVAFRALAGHAPFEADEITSLLFKIVFEEAPPARKWNSDLPEQVDSVLKRALAKDPAARYPSCAEFIEALETALHSLPAMPPEEQKRSWAKTVAIAVVAGLGCLTLMAGVSILISEYNKRPPDPVKHLVEHAQGAQSGKAPNSAANGLPASSSPAPEAKSVASGAAADPTDVAKPAAASPTPVVTRAPLRGMADWEKAGEWFSESTWMVHKGGNFVLFGPTGEAGTFNFSAIVIKGKRLQWFANYQNPKDYALFQIEKRQFTAREVVNGVSKERAKTAVVTRPFFQLAVALTLHTVITSLYDGEEWRVLDTWRVKERDVTQGKFGFLIPGSDQIGLANFRFTPD